jgi:hypothetical protein
MLGFVDLIAAQCLAVAFESQLQRYYITSNANLYLRVTAPPPFQVIGSDLHINNFNAKQSEVHSMYFKEAYSVRTGIAESFVDHKICINGSLCNIYPINDRHHCQNCIVTLKIVEGSYSCCYIDTQFNAWSYVYGYKPYQYTTTGNIVDVCMVESCIVIVLRADGSYYNLDPTQLH